MTPDTRSPDGLRRFVALSSDQIWFGLAVLVGLMAATALVEAVMLHSLPEVQGVGF